MLLSLLVIIHSKKKYLIRNFWVHMITFTESTLQSLLSCTFSLDFDNDMLPVALVI